MTHTSRPQAQTAVTTASSERAANGDERDHNARLVLERDPIVGKIIALAIRTEFMTRHVAASHELPGSIGARWSELVVELAKAPIPAWSAIEPADLRAACAEMLERIEERDRLLQRIPIQQTRGGMSDSESARTVGGSSAAAGEDPMRGLRHRMEVCDDNVAKLYINCVRTSGHSSDVALPPDSPLVIEPERPAVRVAWAQMKQALTLPSTPGA